MYTFTRSKQLDDFAGFLGKLASIDYLADSQILQYMPERLQGLDPSNLATYSSFHPPRLIRACRNGALIPFFGAGLSLAAGIPSWYDLLSSLNIPSEFLGDPQLDNDPLTQAEIIAHNLGRDMLQKELREKVNAVKKPTVAHFMLASLGLPVNFTTNYDDLFEEAWRKIHPDLELVTVSNDLDIARYQLGNPGTIGKGGRCYLFKIHGCVARTDEHLILTRSDYRYHYHANAHFFEVVKLILRSGVVMFMGFSHKDPEVTRLVEDMIYDHESKRATDPANKAPTIYSIQFDMITKTPEVFAARGIVALRPPASIARVPQNLSKGMSLATSLVELYAGATVDIHERMDFENDLKSCVEELSSDLEKGMDVLASVEVPVIEALGNADRRSRIEQIIEKILPTMGSMAGQGIYVTDEKGEIIGMALLPGLNKDERAARRSFSDRPYFRQAKTFRKPFVSDVYKSVYNGNSTIFLCHPVVIEHRFAGLIFSAAQPGTWIKPDSIRMNFVRKGVEFALVDSNGILVVPTSRIEAEQEPQSLPSGEKPEANAGYRFSEMLKNSRRDIHIAHIVENIVPVGFDDDIHEISSDYKVYSMAANVRNSKWKLFLSAVVQSSGHGQ